MPGERHRPLRDCCSDATAAVASRRSRRSRSTAAARRAARAPAAGIPVVLEPAAPTPSSPSGPSADRSRAAAGRRGCTPARARRPSGPAPARPGSDTDAGGRRRWWRSASAARLAARLVRAATARRLWHHVAVHGHGRGRAPATRPRPRRRRRPRAELPRVPRPDRVRRRRPPAAEPAAGRRGIDRRSSRSPSIGRRRQGPCRRPAHRRALRRRAQRRRPGDDGRRTRAPTTRLADQRARRSATPVLARRRRPAGPRRRRPDPASTVEAGRRGRRRPDELAQRRADAQRRCGLARRDRAPRPGCSCLGQPAAPRRRRPARRRRARAGQRGEVARATVRARRSPQAEAGGGGSRTLEPTRRRSAVPHVGLGERSARYRPTNTIVDGTAPAPSRVGRTSHARRTARQRRRRAQAGSLGTRAATRRATISADGQRRPGPRAVAGRGQGAVERVATGTGRCWSTVSIDRPASVPLPPETSVRM